jgi:3-methyladenine DNA glycosylase AlkD
MNHIEKIVSTLETNRNLIQAEKMSAYMRNKFPFYGVTKPNLDKHFGEWWKQSGKMLTRLEKWDLIEALWQEEFRESHYWAIQIMLKMKNNDFEPSDIDKFKFVIVNHSWWDSVDLIASNTLTQYSLQFPEETKMWVEEWTISNNIWLQRSTLIFQLKLKSNTDLELLSKQISTLKKDKEFFIQKAIGWSLREVSKTNKEWVRLEIERQNLYGLSKREASKYL